MKGICPPAWIFLLASLVANNSATAADFYDEPFLFRFLSSLNRSVNYASSAALQASAASPQSSSVNPASGTEGEASTTLTNINALGQSDAWVTALAGTVHFIDSSNGHWTPAYAYTDTLDENNNFGLNTGLRSHEFFLEYAQAVTPNLSLGVNFRYTHANIWHEMPLPSMGGIPIKMDVRADAADIGAGLLWKITNEWSLGLLGGGSIGYSDTTLTTIGSSGNLPAGIILATQEDERFTTWTVRAGLGYFPLGRLRLYGDIHWYGIESENQGGLDLGLASLGGEWQCRNHNRIRVGLTADTEHNITYAAGIRIFVSEDIPFDLAYQHNGAPEIEPEFGRIDLITASVAFPI